MSGSHKPTNFPWLMMSESLGEDNVGIGGMVIRAKAAAALNIGDAVFISAANTVNKSTTAADYQKRAGIVVGGENMFMTVLQDDDDIGEIAADANEDVLVCIAGMCRGVAGATLAAGDRLIADGSTAGRLKVGAIITATVDSGGTTVTSTAANGAIITVAGDGISTIIGQAWTAAAAAGDKFTVFMQLS